jgi:hypothetical protein
VINVLPKTQHFDTHANPSRLTNRQGSITIGTRSQRASARPRVRASRTTTPCRHQESARDHENSRHETPTLSFFPDEAIESSSPTLSPAFARVFASAPFEERIFSAKVCWAMVNECQIPWDAAHVLPKTGPWRRPRVERCQQRIREYWNVKRVEECEGTT